MKTIKVLVCLALLTSMMSCQNDIDIQKTSAPPAITTPRAVGAPGIAGVNWADSRDNFVDGWVIPSGLTSSDSYATVTAKAQAILTGFQMNMPGVNTVRLPINPSTVLDSWWSVYTGAIDAAVGRNMKVILSCWESASSRDGIVDNSTEFWAMWQTVVNKYGTTSNVYFEVFNEPHGYTLVSLTSLYAEWLSRYPNVPKGRIILGGTGYSENVTQVGADSRFTNCLLALHNYAYWATRTTAGWESDWRSRIGSYASRTVVTEFGATMNSGKNYAGSQSDNEVAYLVGSTNVFRNDGVSSVYWPGLRDGDSYSIQTRGGSGTAITLTTTNYSGVHRIRYGWGEAVGSYSPSAYYRIVNRNSGKVMDINGSSTADGAAAIQWTWSGGNNQQWQLIESGGGYYRLINRNSGKVADVTGASTVNGAAIIQYAWVGGANQLWHIIDNGSGYYRIINKGSGKALDVSGASAVNGASVIQWIWSGGNNQQWQIVQQ